MCGNIKKLRFPDRPASDDEIAAAVHQYLRKIGNMRKPSAMHQRTYDEAASAICESVRTMLDGLQTRRINAVSKALFKAID